MDSENTSGKSGERRSLAGDRDRLLLNMIMEHVDQRRIRRRLALRRIILRGWPYFPDLR